MRAKFSKITKLKDKAKNSFPGLFGDLPDHEYDKQYDERDLPPMICSQVREFVATSSQPTPRHSVTTVDRLSEVANGLVGEGRGVKVQGDEGREASMRSVPNDASGGKEGQTRAVGKPLDAGEDYSPAFADAMSNLNAATNMIIMIESNATPSHLEISIINDLALLLHNQFSWVQAQEKQLSGQPLPTLEVLERLYGKCRGVLGDKRLMDEDWGEGQIRAMEGLQKLLNEGPKYLFVLLTLEAMQYQAELVDSTFADQLLDVLDTLKSARATPSELQNDIQDVLADMKDVPSSSIADKQAKRAWAEITALAGKLEELGQTFAGKEERGGGKVTFVQGSAQAKSASRGVAAEDSGGLKSALKKPGSSSDKAKASGEGATSRSSEKPSAGEPDPTDDDEEEEEEEELPQLYNHNGDIVTLSAMELLEEQDQLIERGLWERDGVIMTSSALSLLQAQEALERMDSAGHGEWGHDTWDGIRGQYIPKWVRKLTDADQWPLLDENGRTARDENGDPLGDWFDVNLDAVEERNLRLFGVDGAVDYPY